MNWIHCNRCKIHSKDHQHFHMATCGHLFCTNCMNTVPHGGKCLFCKVDCAYTSVNKDMSPDMKMFFRDPIVHLQNFLKCYGFQQMHRRILLQHGQKVRQMYDKLKYQLDREREHSRKFSLAANASERQFHYMKSKLEHYEKKETAVFTPNTSGFGFGHRISPYDKKSSTKSAVLPSFLLDHSSSHRTPAFANRTMDSAGNSTGSSRFTPYSMRGDRSFNSPGLSAGRSGPSPRLTPVRNVTPILNNSKPFFPSPRSNIDPRSNFDPGSNRNSRPNLDRSVIASSSNLASGPNRYMRGLENASSNSASRPKIPFFCNPTVTSSNNILKDSNRHTGISPFQEKFRQLSVNQSHRSGDDVSRLQSSNRSGSNASMVFPFRPSRNGNNHLESQHSMQSPYFNRGRTPASNGRHARSSPPLISQELSQVTRRKMR